MLEKALGKTVKDQELLRSPILLLQMLELARGDDEAVISATSKLQDRRAFRKGCVGEHVKCIPPQHNIEDHRLSEPMVLFDEGSVQLVSTSLALRPPQKVEHF